MRNRDEIQKQINFLADNDNEPMLTLFMVFLEIQLDTRDLLIDIRNRTKEVVVDFVPPDYGKEDQL